ncbi:MAG TPA: D-arabinono-1,4-lactone oxidase, partial [Candidatus Babeliaceae bacterium]|nr:D-arabinono-1,4-lactone oxidase [Candidatus Babeliaceae bacterium]
GLLGIIVEVTLELTDDVILEKKITSINAESLADHFRNVINPNRAIQFYSARFSIGKSDLLNKVLVLTYERTDAVDPKLFEFKVGASSYLQKIGWLGIEKTEWVKNIRYFLEKNWFELPEKISRNNFMGYTVNSLPQDTAQSSYILQEYFIPYGCLNEFITHLRSMVERYGINLLNVTARHVPADKQTLLTYAPEDACALVLYIQLDRSERIYDQALVWTRSLIEKALEFSGTYYLPYHLIATQDQLQHAYPHFKDFLELKKIYDPHGIFSNKLYSKYFTINSCY